MPPAMSQVLVFESTMLFIWLIGSLAEVTPTTSTPVSLRNGSWKAILNALENGPPGSRTTIRLDCAFAEVQMAGAAIAAALPVAVRSRRRRVVVNRSLDIVDPP